MVGKLSSELAGCRHRSQAIGAAVENGTGHDLARRIQPAKFVGTSDPFNPVWDAARIQGFKTVNNFLAPPLDKAGRIVISCTKLLGEEQPKDVTAGIHRCHAATKED